MPTLSCHICGKEYYRKPSEAVKSKYCSYSCSGKGTLSKLVRTKEWYDKVSKAIKGIKRSVETRERIRASKIGHKQSHEQIAKRIQKNTGQKRSQEVKERMSSAAFLVPKEKRARGAQLPRWKGGITHVNAQIRSSSEYKQWRRDVMRRDKWTCVKCGYKGKNIHADHIKPFFLFPELRLDVSNGRTLCKTCHRNTPTYGINAEKMTRQDFLKQAV